ncbi:MAG: ActS/PrrB/RegB family redox-sensitive histidine kinase [Rhodospirillaceae bacterium]
MAAMQNVEFTAPPDTALRVRRTVDGRGEARLDGRVTARTLVLMRWIAITGQLISFSVLTWGLGLEMQDAPILATIAASVLLNVVLLVQRGNQFRLSDRNAALYLAFDTLQLTTLLYLTGGMVNSFTILLLAPVTVGAAILSRFSVFLLAVLNQACLAIIAVWHYPLPWRYEPFELPWLYSLGEWSGLSMASLLLTAYVFRVASESRRISDALAASQMALAREQRLSALGGLAAAAAHELGTPLGTIVIVAAELARDIAANSPIAEDIALLRSQSLRCRDILAELGRQPELDGGAPFEYLPLTTLIETAALPHRANTAAVLTIIALPSDGLPEPVVRRLPEILHGVGNLLQNALQFAQRNVEAVAAWDIETITLIISDDGPGFSSHVLSRIGEPYISARSNRSGHMGLGIFIAETLLSHTGARVEFSNCRPGGGARVLIRWPRQALNMAE